MSYLVLARKWRPQTFEDVVGQTATTRALTSALSSGRVAHAFLFAGPRGVGKTTAARVLAKALNCDRGPGPQPCNSCTNCEEITSGRSVDVLEIDGASNTGVDDVRELRERVKYLPARARYKVLIIDEVHMLSGNAFNALLKTLEEPPAHVIFVFATTEPHKIPATVLSRVQRYDFRRIPYALVMSRLAEICRAEAVEAAEGALAVIACEADGSMRDALSLLDQAWSSASQGRLVEAEVAEALGVVDRTTLLGLGRALLGRDVRACLRLLDQAFARGYDVRHFASALLGLLRDLAVAKVAGAEASFDRPDHEVREMQALVGPHDAAGIYRLFDTLARAFDEIARADYPKLLLEMTLLKMASQEPLRSLAEAIAQLQALERRLGAGGGREGEGAPPGPGGPGPSTPERTGMLAAEATAPAPPVSGGEPRAVWREIIREVGRRRRSLAAVFEAGRLLALGPDEVRVAFGEPFLLERASERESLAVLTTVCREALGAQARVQVVPLPAHAGEAPVSLAEESRRQAAEERESKRQGLAEHPHVQAARDLLGARLLEVRVEAMDE
jgi:DNA polymerase-3 subunit gamma/tau